ALTSSFALLAVSAVHGDVTITGNASLVEIAAPHAIDGQLVVENNPALTALDTFDLQRADSIAVRGNAALTDALLSALTSVSTLEIASNPTLATLDLPKLTQAHEIHIDHNHALASCDVLAIFAHITADVLEQSDNDDAKVCTP